MVFDTPTEIDILLSCARRQITPERAGTIQEALKNGIDWEYLFRVAGRHGLVPLLYHQLTTIVLNLSRERHSTDSRVRRSKYPPAEPGAYLIANYRLEINANRLT